MSTIIKPTVGRKVWYFTSARHHEGFTAGEPDNQPYDATILFADNDRDVNLLVVDHLGITQTCVGVQLFQEGDDTPRGAHARWMPYQTGQAAKAEKAAGAAPAATDTAIEQEIQAKGLTAPRVTPAEIEVNIATEHYFTALNAFNREGSWDGISDEQTMKSAKALSLLTFCVLVLRNGFTVTGESACASPENFDAEIGRKIARQNAVQKIWPLMGYELRSKLSQQ
jgi:hypothetical protein